MPRLITLGAPPLAEDLLAPVRASFQRFLQPHTAPDRRADHGLQAVLRAFFPVTSPDGAFAFEYVSYDLEPPRHTAAECRRRGLTHAAPLKLTLRYRIRDVTRAPPETRDLREQEIYFGVIPLLDVDGTFVFDGRPVRLVNRALALWLPEDGQSAPPQHRTMLPGEWLAHAFHTGLAQLGPPIQKAFAHRHAETLMPHDVVEPPAVMRAMQQLFDDPLRAAPVTGNPVARLALARGVEGPVTLGAKRARALGKRTATRTATLDLAGALCPFSGLERHEGGRALEEARVLCAPTAPRVQTGAEGAVVEALGLVHRAEHDGTLEILDDETALLWPDEPTREALDGVVLAFDRRLPGGREGERTRFCAASSGRVRAGEVVAEAEGSVGGLLALGREARVVFDARATGVVVSEELAEAMRAARLHVFEAELRSTPHGVEEPSSADGAGLDEDGVIPLGAAVAPGTVLVGIASWLDVGPMKTSAQRGEVKARFPDGVPRAERSLRAPEGVYGTVIGVEVLNRRGMESGPREGLAVARWRAIREAAGRREGPLAEALREEADDRIQRLERGFDLPPGVRRWVRVTVEVSEPLRVGDRLVDRGGFGGVVSAVVAGGEMPAFGDGRADVVLPGARVPAGTLREAWLGHAGWVLDEACVGEVGELQIAEMRARAGLAVTSTEGVLYLLRTDAP